MDEIHLAEIDMNNKEKYGIFQGVKEGLGKHPFRKIFIPSRYNYIAAFLTLECNFNCSYCINSFSNKMRLPKDQMSGREWVTGLNRIVSRNDLPVTLQGGEPSLHPDFIWVINNLKKDLKIDILTNLQFDVDEFIAEVDPNRLKRDAPYASIRVSYHSENIELDELIFKVKRMQEAGFSIGVYGIFHPQFEEIILYAQKKCWNLGIDFRIKEFLGEFNGKIYGTYLYNNAITRSSKRRCLCRTTELIIGPSGNIYRCHQDLYENLTPIGHILDRDFQIEDRFRECWMYGYCNPCDIKIKTNRFQQFGHTSVEIKDIR